MSNRTRKLSRLSTMLCVVFAVLFASVYAPAHATAMVLPATVEHAEPCPMTGAMIHHSADVASDTPVEKRADMSCCPAPALGGEGRMATVFRVSITFSTPHLSDKRASLIALAVDPGPPRA